MSQSRNTPAIRRPYWTGATKFLHGGMAVTVTLQLLLSLVMQVPHPHRAPAPSGLLFFQLHEWVGLATVAVIVAHWGYSAFFSGDADFAHLFPWSRTGRAAIWRDIRTLLAWRLPEDTAAGLSGFTHGLGLLAVTGMAVTGLVLFFTFGHGTATARHAAFLHSFVANFAWAYWYGHVGMALIHAWQRDGIMTGIFGRTLR
ncbi:MAG: cytochrome b/b6 domain-containing protein [Gammaproteobacteria bacterium]|nr:cytochrome b/b6 domain-containing protein [Gammaproteobacteria bacterium]